MEKENLPKWEDITEDELGKLISEGNTKSIIAKMFNVDIKDVQRKVRQFRLPNYYCTYKYPSIENNNRARNLLLNDNHLLNQMVSYLIYSTPIKDNLSINDARKLNRILTLKLSEIYDIIKSGEYFKILSFLDKGDFRLDDNSKPVDDMCINNSYNEAVRLIREED